MNKFLLIIIILIASFLRLNQLTTLPALNADEAAIGYNAYSLLKTGMDEHGNPWPIHFQSFNDYKPGLYFYLVLPFVHFLGLTEAAVRLPGALLGILTVFLVYLLAKKIAPEKKYFPHLAALFLTLSPWHIHFSRGGWEVNAATFFITAGVLTYLYGIKRKKIWILSAIFFVLSLYTYHASRIVVALILVGFAALHKDIIFKRLKYLYLVFFLSLLLLIPLIRDMNRPEISSRAAGVGLFADAGPFSRTNEQRGEHGENTYQVSRVIHNKVVNYGLAFLSNYSEHFWGEFLFLSGDDIQRNKVPEMGMLYLIEFLFLLVGLIMLLKKHEGWGVVLVWLFVAPAAAALTFQSPHALRAQNMVIPLELISAYGAISIFYYLKMLVKNRTLLYIGYLLLVISYSWDVSRYVHQYYYHMAQTYDYSSQYGLKELVSYVSENQDKFNQVVVTNRYDQPYILFLFYLKYPPDIFQKGHVLTQKDQFGFSTVESFGKYKFTETFPWDKIGITYRNALIAGTDSDIPDASNILKTIYFPSGRVVFQVVAN